MCVLYAGVIGGTLRLVWVRCFCVVLCLVDYRSAITLCLTHATAANAVDLYNSATGIWSTAQLSVGRRQLSATSVGGVALFAGGYSGNVLLFRSGILRNTRMTFLVLRLNYI